MGSKLIKLKAPEGNPGAGFEGTFYETDAEGYVRIPAEALHHFLSVGFEDATRRFSPEQIVVLLFVEAVLGLPYEEAGELTDDEIRGLVDQAVGKVPATMKTLLTKRKTLQKMAELEEKVREAIEELKLVDLAITRIKEADQLLDSFQVPEEEEEDQEDQGDHTPSTLDILRSQLAEATADAEADPENEAKAYRVRTITENIAALEEAAKV